MGNFDTSYRLLAVSNKRDHLLHLLRMLKWKSIDKDNMEFQCTITYSQMDAIRKALR